MSKKEHIVRYSDEELRAMMQRGESKSDWAAAAAMTEEEIEAAIASDADEAGMEVDWSTVSVEIPGPKVVLNMRVDYDILEFFRSQGKGYQKKIHAVLRSYVEEMQKHQGMKS